MEDTNNVVELVSEDKNKIDKVLELIDEGVTISTGFLSAKDSGFLTHQYIQLECGDYVSMSAPEPLAYPLMIASAQAETVN